MRGLKIIRVSLALFTFLSISLIFLDFKGVIDDELYRAFTWFQFAPSVLEFSVTFAITSVGFIVIMVLTILIGRFYCSALCPLGILMDIIIRLRNKFKKPKRFRFSKPNNWLHYIILVITAIMLIAGIPLLLNLLDPYSNFGKIMANIFRPLLALVNNTIAHKLENAGYYFLYPVTILKYSWSILIYPLIFFVAILALTLWRGRIFCNTLCPVGGVLSLLSKTSFFKLTIDSPSCTQCGKCSTSCKAGCINIKTKSLDFSRCIGCYNCISACDKSGIGFRKSTYKNDSPIELGAESKRNFLLTVFGLFTLSKISEVRAGDIPLSTKDNTIRIKKTTPVTPPGSISVRHFTSRCTACHLCVSACPSQVIKPSSTEYGFTGIMQPYLDFTNSFCEYSCQKCSEVCPTGAILSLSPERKKTTQIGIVHFIKENCIVYTQDTSCGACSEHCPTKAVYMIEYKGWLTIPETNKEICVGCGACEYACPAIPNKAIFVDGNPVHQVTKLPEVKQVEKPKMEEFPF